MIFKRSLTLPQLARRAFLAHLEAYQGFSDALLRFECERLKIEDMQLYFNLSLQADRKWLDAEARVREANICHLIPDDYDHVLDQGIEQNRLVALTYLREQCGVKM